MHDQSSPDAEQNHDKAPSLTVNEDAIKRALLLWEERSRANPSAFKPAAACLALPAEQVAGESAAYFFELLREAAAALPPRPEQDPQQAPYTLHFYEWQCGHHGQRPADIPVHSIEQANLVLSAISHAISQPGHARAALYDDHLGASVYLTDDSVDQIGSLQQPRTTIYLASAAELEDLRGLKDAFDYAYGGTLTEWDGKTWLDDWEVVTTLSQAEVEAAIAPVSWHEADQRSAVCDVPPTILPAETLLVNLRQFREELAANTVQEGGAA